MTRMLDRRQRSWEFLSGSPPSPSLESAGVYLVRFIAQQTLTPGYAVFLMVMGVLILFQNRAVFGPL